MKAVTVRHEHLLCPHCGKGEHDVSHVMISGSFGPWYCNECGGEFEGRRGTSGEINVELRSGRKVITVDVLVLPPQEQDVYFVVEGMRFEPPSEQQPERERLASSFYEEHSCPINWLKPVMVYTDGDSDPHGLLKFVSTVDSAALPPDESYGPNDRDLAMVALIEAAIAKQST